RDGCAELDVRTARSTNPTEEKVKGKPDLPSMRQKKQNRRPRYCWPFVRRGKNGEQQNARPPGRHTRGRMQILRAIGKHVPINDVCVLNQSREITDNTHDSDQR